MKGEILQAYEVVPEAYCQMFQDTKCLHSSPLAGHLHSCQQNLQKGLVTFLWAWTRRGCYKVLQILSYLLGGWKGQTKTNPA